MSQPTLTIDLDAVAANWRALDGLSGNAETAAAVKADGYGCGAVPIAQALAKAGCRTLFVATLEEGIALRESGAAIAIYVLNGVIGDEAHEAKARHLRPCLNHLGQIASWRAADGAACALQLDSGMSRLGLPVEEIDDIPVGLDVRIVLSHLSCSDESSHRSNALQRERFEASVSHLGQRAPRAKLSLAATGGTLLGPDYHYDLVRCGIGNYGGYPFEDAEPVVRLDAPVLQIRSIPKGQPVGYGWSWTAQRDARIATLPLGYADGIHRALSNRGRVFIGGQAVPFAGRVSMDLITIDVTDCPTVQVGDPVEIIGPNQTIDDLATAADTIGYEILTSLGSRYRRRYKSDQVTT